MANVNIRTSECAWHQTELKLLGRTVKGLRGFSYKKTAEKEHLYGAGNDPLDIQDGNKAYEGSITVLGYELDQLNETARLVGFADITEVPHEAIVATLKYQKTKLDKKVFIAISGIAFSEWGSEMKQGDKNREVQLPFKCMNISPIS